MNNKKLISDAMAILAKRGVAARRKKHGKNFNKHMSWVRSHRKDKKL